MRARAFLLVPGLAALGCAPDARPLVEAHRGGAGYYPQNSRTAMTRALERHAWDAIELDLGLTADRVPVLSHDPWVHESLCARVDGQPSAGRVRLDGLPFAALTAGWECGGLPDPDFPNAALFAEPVMALDELLAMLPDSDPDLLVHLDVKYEPGWTPPAEEFATEILGRWFDVDPPQRFVVSANTAEGVAAFEQWGRANGHDVRTWLAWPTFPVDADPVSIVLGSEGRAALGLEDPRALAEEAGADGLAIYWELARRGQVAAARADGLDVALWTLNDRDLLRAHASWPVTSLITDYPGDLPDLGELP